MFRTSRLALISVFFMLNACGGSDPAPAGDGVVWIPRISDLSVTPSTVPLNAGGGQIMVSGSVDFQDEDGDVRTLTIAVLDQTGAVVEQQSISVPDVNGLTSGTIRGTFLVNTSVPGIFSVQVFVTDATLFDSTTLATQFRVTAPVWSTRTPMPTPRLEFATASVGDRVYVIGGRDALANRTPKPQVATVEIYDPVSDSWTTGPDLPITASGLSAAAIGDKVYAMGGEVLTAIASDDLYELDTASMTWTRLADMPAARHFAASAAVGDELVLAGGSSGGFQVSSLYRYDVATDTWTVGTPMSAAREGAQGANVAGQLLVYGGRSSTHVQDGGYRRITERYDLLTDLWTTQQSGAPRRDFGMTEQNGLVYTFGGNNVARALDWVRVYDLDDDVWSTKTPLPSALGFAQAEPANNGIVVIGTDQTLFYSPADDPL